MVVSGLRLAALGVAGGVVLSPGARDVLANVLFGVAPGDRSRSWARSPRWH